jgi:hypothetical protein
VTTTGLPRYAHEVRAVVLSVRASTLSVLLCKDGRRWRLPGGGCPADQRLRDAITTHLSVDVDVRGIAHLEQLATHSAVKRDPRERVLATAYLALLPADAEPALPAGARWFPVTELPPTILDHHLFVTAAIERLRAKLSYTNIGFALAPPQFTIATLRLIISAALGYEVSATNLTRVMVRRAMIVATGQTIGSRPGGGRPAAVYEFADRSLTVTDPFAVLRPPRTPA